LPSAAILKEAPGAFDTLKRVRRVSLAAASALVGTNATDIANIRASEIKRFIIIDSNLLFFSKPLTAFRAGDLKFPPRFYKRSL
jgi:hypothetical protein